MTDKSRPAQNRPPLLSTRRRFLKYLAMLGIGARTLFAAGSTRAATEPLDAPADWPQMPRRTLGRTGFDASRLVFGCGAALSSGRNDALLETAFAAGINGRRALQRAFSALGGGRRAAPLVDGGTALLTALACSGATWIFWALGA